VVSTPRHGQVCSNKIRIKSAGPGFDEGIGFWQDDGTIKWDDGEVWFRVVASAAASASHQNARGPPPPGESSAASQVPSQGSSSSSADAQTSSAPAAQMGSDANGSASTHREDPLYMKDPWRTNGESGRGGAEKAAGARREEKTWQEGRAKIDWDGKAFASEDPAGETYLSLTKGELLEVRFHGSQPFLESGWSWGRSVQNGLEGWFPPDYADLTVTS